MSKIEDFFPTSFSYENEFDFLDFNVLESDEIQWTKSVNGQPQKVCSDEEVETLFDRSKKFRAEMNEQKPKNDESTSAKPLESTTVAATSGPSTSTGIRAVYPEPDVRRIAPAIIMDAATMIKIAKPDFEISINKRGRRRSFKLDFIGKIYEDAEKMRKKKKMKSAK